jgi:hypothetical protein
MRLRQQIEAEEPIGPTAVMVFQGRVGVTPEMTMRVFGWIMDKLHLWGKLTTPEEMALHNVAMDILCEMRAQPTLGIGRLDKITLLIQYEAKPEGE